MSRAGKQKGFTLIELMVAVAVVAILASIAIPSYRSNIIRTKRNDAQQTLMQGSQAMERTYVTNGSGGYACTPITGALAQSPQSGTAVYAVTCTATASTFTLTATPSTGQSNSGDGVLTLDQLGNKKWKGVAGWPR